MSVKIPAGGAFSPPPDSTLATTGANSFSVEEHLSPQLLRQPIAQGAPGGVQATGVGPLGAAEVSATLSPGNLDKLDNSYMNLFQRLERFSEASHGGGLTSGQIGGHLGDIKESLVALDQSLAPVRGLLKGKGS